MITETSARSARGEIIIIKLCTQNMLQAPLPRQMKEVFVFISIRCEILQINFLR